MGYEDLPAGPFPPTADADGQGSSTTEQLFATLITLFSGLLWAWIIASFAAILTTLDPRETEYRNNLDTLNAYASEYNLPRSLRIQLRLFLHRSRFLYRSRGYHEMLALFSPSLRAEAAWQANGHWVSKVWFLKGLDRHFLVRLTLEMRPAQLTQGELAPAGELMYVLQFGVVLLHGSVKTKGSVWGDDVILSDRWRRSRSNARALSESVELLIISRATLMRCAASHPEAEKHIRKCAVKLALRYELKRISAQSREEQQQLVERGPPRPWRGLQQGPNLLEAAVQAAAGGGSSRPTLSRTSSNASISSHASAVFKPGLPTIDHAKLSHALEDASTASVMEATAKLERQGSGGVHGGGASSSAEGALLGTRVEELDRKMEKLSNRVEYRMDALERLLAGVAERLQDSTARPL